MKSSKNNKIEANKQIASKALKWQQSQQSWQQNKHLFVDG